MFLLYDLIFLLYALVYLPYLLLTKRGYEGFGMRFGLFSSQVKKQIKAKANIWVHAVSVGEVMVLDGFIDRLKKRFPSYQLIATVTTKTGYTLACERLKDKALVIPSPIDFSFVTGRFVSLINPKMYIAVETEIWPNLFRQLYLRHIPLGIINGRISDASFGRYKAVRFLLKGILNQVSVWCMRSQTDADRIMDLGADPLKVAVTGNVKFDDLPETSDFSVSDFASGKDELWWVAGSTHPGEEEIVLDVYAKIIKDNPKWRLVIAPRHVERAHQIKELINGRGYKMITFKEIASSASPPRNDTVLKNAPRNDTVLKNAPRNDTVLKNAPRNDTIIIVDTIGQLRSLYAKASLVFVGKSLCVGGGQNIIEPAFYGKAIVIGPKVENFRDIVACFKEKGAIVQVEDAHAFEISVRGLCADASKRETLGTAAREVVAANRGATERCLECLTKLLNGFPLSRE
jgi:3-deoxy-D-manno-octulosonic-acid transferase